MSLSLTDPSDFPFVPTSPRSVLACKRCGLDPTDLLLQNRTMNDYVMQEYQLILEQGTTFKETISMFRPKDVKYVQLELFEDRMPDDFIISQQAKARLAIREERTLRKFVEMEEKRRQLEDVKKRLKQEADLQTKVEKEKIDLIVEGMPATDCQSDLPVQNKNPNALCCIQSKVSQEEIQLNFDTVNFNITSHTNNMYQEQPTETLTEVALCNEIALNKQFLRSQKASNAFQLKEKQQLRKQKQFLQSQAAIQANVQSRQREKHAMILQNSLKEYAKSESARVSRRIQYELHINRALLIEAKENAESIKKLRWQESMKDRALASCKTEGMRYLWRGVTPQRKQMQRSEIIGLKLLGESKSVPGSKVFLTQNQ